MIQLKSILWMGLLVCFTQAMEIQQPLVNENNNQQGNYTPLSERLEINLNDVTEENIKKLLRTYQIVDRNIVDTASKYFLEKINDGQDELKMKTLAQLFRETRNAIRGLDVNEMIRKRSLTKILYPSPPYTDDQDEFDVEHQTLKIKVQQEIENFKHYCEGCSKTQFTYLVGEGDKGGKAICLDCAISDFDLKHLIEKAGDYPELVVIFLFSQYSLGQTRFQDTTITPQLISDILMITTTALAVAWDQGPTSSYPKGLTKTADSFHIMLLTYFSLQFLGTSWFTAVKYGKRIANGSYPILIFGYLNAVQFAQVILGIVSIIATAGFTAYHVGDAINGIMFGVSAYSIWFSQNIGPFDPRYVAWNENYLALACSNSFKDKQKIIDLSWRPTQGIFSQQLASIAAKGFFAANGFMALSLLKYYPEAAGEFDMPEAFIHAGLIGNVMIWGSWFFVLVASFFLPEMVWDNSLSFSYKLLQVGAAFAIMLCTTSFEPTTKLYINFGSFMIPVMLFVIKNFADGIEAYRNRQIAVNTGLPPKMKYLQLEN